MATAISMSASSLDLKAQATYPIRLGSSISRSAKASQIRSISYNHLPQDISSSNYKSVLRPQDREHDSERVEIAGKDGTYEYAGENPSTVDNYVLLCKGQGKQKELVLERLDSVQAFNLISTPSEDSASRLAELYPHIIGSDNEEGDLFGEDDVDVPPDDANPFDFRHFLKADAEKPTTASNASNSTKSTTNVRLTNSRANGATPVTKPFQRGDGKAQLLKKRKGGVAGKTQPKRVKAGEEPPSPGESTTAKPRKIDIPQVRLDRKASMRRPSLDDSGELILENDTPTSEKLPPARTAMSLALSGQLGHGPVSLHSAASSPASRIASPAPTRPEGMGEEYEFDLGGSSPETTAPRQPPPDEEGDADEEDEDDDADVDDLELPSPAQAHRHSAGAVAVTGGDDDDDLEKGIALAMAEQESEESEEE